MKRTLNNNVIYTFVYILFAIFSFWLAMQIPYTHDDWDWGLENGITQFLTASINSRYVGNFLEVIMTRSILLKNIILGTTYFLIPFSISKIVCTNTSPRNTKIQLSVFLLSNFLLFTMNLNVFQQTYGWIAGFSNFVISVLPLAVLLYEIIPLLDNTPPDANCSPIKLVGLLIISICSQLFTENLTIYLTALTFLACVLCYYRIGKIHSKYLVMLFGCVLGMIIMFSSSIYGTLFQTGSAVDGYRELTVGAHLGLAGSIFKLAKQGAILVKKLWFNNQIICIAILVLLNPIWKNTTFSSNKVKKRFIFINYILIIVLLLGAQLQFNADPQDLVANIIYACISAVYFPLVSIELILLYRSRTERLCKIMLFWLSAPMVIAPLVLTNVAGYRLFFTSNFFLILVAQYLLVDCYRVMTIRKTNTTVVCILIFTLFIGVHMIRVFSAIGDCSSQRAEIISQANLTGDKQIVLPDFPYSDYLWLPNPANESRMEFFKAFYGIADDVEVIISDTPSY